MRFTLAILSALAAFTCVVSSAQAQHSGRYWQEDRRYDARRDRSLYDPAPRRYYKERRRARARARDRYWDERDNFRRRKHRRRAHYCLSKPEIYHKLSKSDLHVHTWRPQGRNTVYVIAHNTRKDRYDLTVSACKGDVLTIKRTQTVKKRGLKGFLRKIF